MSEPRNPSTSISELNLRVSHRAAGSQTASAFEKIYGTTKRYQPEARGKHLIDAMLPSLQHGLEEGLRMRAAERRGPEGAARLANPSRRRGGIHE